MAFEAPGQVRRAPAPAAALGAALGLIALGALFSVASVSAAPGDEEGEGDTGSEESDSGESDSGESDTGEPSPDDEALLEFHFSPVDDLQISVWLEDAGGNHLDDVYITQATGKLGIGNRPGLVKFLSSWRAPYGPRESVLPIWAHRRGKTYPKIIFHDKNTNNHSSLGFHESSSSPETYFCRPLTPIEDEAIIDTMTCPSPATFQSDKGQFLDGVQPSVYPPRNDLTMFEDDDSAVVQTYADLNELDGITGATPSAGPYVVAHRIRRGDVPEGPLFAWIEVSLERDENPNWTFDREDDHWVDPKLSAYGRAYLGQPAVVYRVEFDPSTEGYTSIVEYEGYADWDGATGSIHAPDGSLSGAGGSGFDRLQIHEVFGDSGRFGVFSHGWVENSGGTGDSSDSGGGCNTLELPPIEDLRLEPTGFSEVTATFRIPELPQDHELTRLRAWWQTPEVSEFLVAESTEAGGIAKVCQGSGETDCVDAQPGDEVSVVIDQLFGNYSYTVGITYEDNCANESTVTFGDATTPNQPFQTIDGACFIATAAWGAGWTEELRALRWFRDDHMIGTPIAHDMVRMYYAYGPTLAKMIRHVPPARAAARLALRPIADLVSRLQPTGPAADPVAPAHTP